MSTKLNDNIQSNSPKSLDNKYMVDGVTPYTDVAHVNSVIPLSYRSIGLKVNIANVDYWYKDGVQDIDLIPFVSGSLVIQDNGVDLPNQPKLNFAGISIKAEDNPLNNATDVHFTGKVCSLEIQPLNYTFGTTVNFTKQDYVPNIDVVSSGLEITRDDSGEWLFNPLQEVSATPTSPTNSLWYGNITNNQQWLDAVSNLSGLPFVDFSTAVSNSIGSFDNLASNGGTLWIMKDDQNRYWTVLFVAWTVTQVGQKATNYLEISGALNDGTEVEIGTNGRLYSYNLALNQWTNDDGGVFTSLVDCINNDASRQVDAFDDFGNVRVYALNDGAYGNSIPTLVSPMNNIIWIEGNFLVNGVTGSGGGGFSYQRAEILVLCEGSLKFGDNTVQTTAPSKIQNEGVTLPSRPFIDYKGSGVDVTDNGIKTIVTINSAYRKIINVDSTYGDNIQALTDPYNQSNSFSTLESAVATAVAGDLIFVSSGNYTPSSNIAKDGVDWYFCPNAIVTGSTPFFAQNMSFNVYGFGTFINNGFAAPFFFIINSRVNITCSKYIAQASFYGCVLAIVE